jgi:hypothetical protein
VRLPPVLHNGEAHLLALVGRAKYDATPSLTYALKT